VAGLQRVTWARVAIDPVFTLPVPAYGAAERLSDNKSDTP